MAETARKVIGAITSSNIFEHQWAEDAHGFTVHTDASVLRRYSLGYGGTVHTTRPLSQAPELKRKVPKHEGVTHAIGNDRTIFEAAEGLVEATGQTAAIELHGTRPFARRLRLDEPDPAA